MHCIPGRCVKEIAPIGESRKEIRKNGREVGQRTMHIDENEDKHGIVLGHTLKVATQ